MQTDPALHRPGEPWNAAFAWIEAELGGTLVRAERQARWRPAWFLELERDGVRLPLYFRGARPELAASVAALEHEMRVLQTLERHEIPVPHVHGFCPEPPGIVMDRSPGRANLASEPDAARREAILRQYMDVLVRMHALPVEDFEAIGLSRPIGDAAIGRCDLPRWEASYRKSKSRPEPVIEFCLRWLERNLPRGRRSVAFLAADSGQFLFEEGAITAVLDLELSCLGDPAADLAGMRGRDLSEPLGDLRPAFEHYFAGSGARIPHSVIDYHTVRFNLYTPMAVAPLVARPPPQVDLVQYLGWYWVWSRACLEVIACTLRLSLEAVELPPVEASRHASAHDALCGRLEAAAGGEDFRAYEMDAAYRAAAYLRRAERHGPALEAAQCEEVSRLTGRSVSHWETSDEALESWLLEAPPEADAELVGLLHRRCLRQEALLQPVLRELEGASIQLLD